MGFSFYERFSNTYEVLVPLISPTPNLHDYVQLIQPATKSKKFKPQKVWNIPIWVKNSIRALCPFQCLSDPNPSGGLFLLCNLDQSLIYWATGRNVALHCTALHIYNIVLHWHCTVLHCISQYYTALHCAVLYCTALYCTALHGFTNMSLPISMTTYWRHPIRVARPSQGLGGAESGTYRHLWNLLEVPEGETPY